MAMNLARTELLIETLSRRIARARTIAVGASSPIPAAAALLVRERNSGTRVLMLGSRRHNAYTDGGRELFDSAAQGRLDAFFLGGGQIDGQANINLIGLGDPLTHRFPGSFGSAYMYFLVPVILFREEHSPRVLVPKVDFISAPGVSPPNVYRPGGPQALVTGRCVFDFRNGRFALASVHPGETTASIRAATGFDYDAPAHAPETPGPDRGTRATLRGAVRAALAETYPRFAAEWTAALDGTIS